MKRSLLALGAALLLLGLLVPAVLASGAAGPAEDPVPVPEPTAPPHPTPTPFDGNGEIVIDPTFITASPTPAGEVRGATSRPRLTPPPTDTLPAATASGTGLQVLLVLGVAAACLAPFVARPPATRRR